MRLLILPLILFSSSKVFSQDHFSLSFNHGFFHQLNIKQENSNDFNEVAFYNSLGFGFHMENNLFFEVSVSRLSAKNIRNNRFNSVKISGGYEIKIWENSKWTIPIKIDLGFVNRPIKEMPENYGVGIGGDFGITYLYKNFQFGIGVNHFTTFKKNVNETPTSFQQTGTFAGVKYHFKK